MSHCQEMYETNVSIGARFEEERVRMGKTQDVLANDVGVNRRTIGRIENGETPPAGDLLSLIAQLGFDTQYILTGVRSENLYKVAEPMAEYKTDTRKGALAKDEEVLVEKYRQLRPADRARAQAIVNALVTVEIKKEAK